MAQSKGESILTAETWKEAVALETARQAVLPAELRPQPADGKPMDAAAHAATPVTMTA